MKRNLDTGVEVCDNRVKKNQRHTTNEKPNMCYLLLVLTLVNGLHFVRISPVFGLIENPEGSGPFFLSEGPLTARSRPPDKETQKLVITIQQS